MIESIKQNRKGILLMLISSISVCFGQLFWKLSVEHGFSFILLGFFLYGVGALLMIIAYRYGRVSVLQPMLSLNYILSIVLAALILDEKISVTKCIGILVIIIGVILIAGGDSKN